LGTFNAGGSVRRRIPMLATRRHIVLLVALAALFVTAKAQAGGGAYVFSGGSEAARAQVRAALEASSFDWGLVPCDGDGSDRRLRLRGLAPRPHRLGRGAAGVGALRPRVHMGDRPARIRAPGLGLRARRRRQGTSPSAAPRRRPLLRAAGPPAQRPRLRALCGHARVGLLARSGEPDSFEQSNERPPFSRAPGRAPRGTSMGGGRSLPAKTASPLLKR
jgi:hypothetical protein